MTVDEFLRTHFQVDGANLVNFAGMAVGILRGFRGFDDLDREEGIEFSMAFAAAVMREADAQNFARSVAADLEALPVTPSTDV